MQPIEIVAIELCAGEACIAPTDIDGENPDGSWTFQLGMDAPETVRVMVHDSSSARLIRAKCL